jgi:hypothetical protein
MREGTTSWVTAVDRPCGKFYDFHSVSLDTTLYTSSQNTTCAWRQQFGHNEYKSRLYVRET